MGRERNTKRTQKAQEIGSPDLVLCASVFISSPCTGRTKIEVDLNPLAGLDQALIALNKCVLIEVAYTITTGASITLQDVLVF